ncbi:MAG: acyl carrier protein [Nitrospirae bacterium]|nr:acyl carrier protein [Nitrospirota bacterium]
MEERIKKVLSAVFEIPADSVNDQSSPDTIQQWDSIKHMQMVIALEEEFGFQFTDEEIIELLNYSLIREIISSKI